MGYSYPMSSSSYQSYSYPSSQFAQQGGTPVDGNPSLVSNENPSYVSNSPMTGAQDNRFISNKTIKKHLDDAMNALKPKSIFQKIGDFFKGIFNGIVNIFKSLANPKNWPLIIGAVALCIICPPAGAVLAGVGAVMAGAKMIKGAQSGNWEQVGEGTLDLGLSAVGFKAATADVKAGGTKFSLAGTRTADANTKLADAEAKLDNLTKAGANATEIQNAEAAVAQCKQAQQASMSDQARIEAARMNFWTKSRFLKKTDTADLSPAQMQTKVAQTAEEFNAARTQVLEAEATLKSAEASGASTTDAAANLATAQKNLAEAAQNNLDMLKAQRIKETKAMGYGERTKAYFKDYKDTSIDSLKTFGGKTLTSVDGRTATYWKRTPKGPNGEVLPKDPNQAGLWARVKGWWNPNKAAGDAVATEGKTNGISVPKGGSPGSPPPNNNQPNGQDAQKAAAMARSARDAVVSKWQEWRQSQMLNNVGDAAWTNKYNVLVPVTEYNS